MIENPRLGQYIKDLGVYQKENSKSFVFDCPLCGGEDKLYIRKSDGKFKCFRCVDTNKFSGLAPKALAALSGVKEETIAKELLEENLGPLTQRIDINTTPLFGTDIEETPVVIPTPKEYKVVQFSYNYLQLDHPNAKPGVEYLESRGVPKDIAAQYGIRYSPYSNTIIFPIEVGGKLYGWQHRVAGTPTVKFTQGWPKRSPKAWSSADCPREDLVAFSNRLQGVRRGVVCEGPIDALKAHLVQGNIATLGKDITQKQIDFILSFGVESLVWAIDPDALGRIKNIIKKVPFNIKHFVVELPRNKKDLGECSFQEAKTYIDNAQLYHPHRPYIYVPSLFGA